MTKHCHWCPESGNRNNRANKAMDRFNAQLLKQSDWSVMLFAAVLMVGATVGSCVVSQSIQQNHASHQTR